MANVIKLRKGLDINLKGKAAETYATVKEPGFYALVPDDFPGVTPKVVVKEQDRKSTRLNSSHRSQSRMPSSA